MIKRMIELGELINRVDLAKLWPGFKKTNFAIYNEETVYLNDDYEIDIDLLPIDSIFIGKVDNRFVGNTAIAIKEQYLAIWNENYIPSTMSNTALASKIVHEMFHCLQYENHDAEKFPNEILGIDYPITAESINLRTLERQFLLEWVSAENKDRKLDLVNKYFTVREKREKLVGSAVNYEKAMEEFEGIASYVELKSLMQLSDIDGKTIIKDFFQGFADITEANLQIRHSSYRQGVLLALIADEYLTNWKEVFQESDQHLSDFIREKIKCEKQDIVNIDQNLSKVEKVIRDREEAIKKLFYEFNSEDKENVFKENIEITGFDPMNIIKRNDEMIHNSFIRVKIDGDERIIKGPVKVTIGNDFFDVKKIEW